MKCYCPYCEVKYEVEKRFAGQMAECESCKKSFQIPALPLVPTQQGQSKPGVRPGDSPEMKKCPMCEEMILAAAKKCRYCGEYLTERPKSRTVYFLLGFFFGMLGIHNFYAKEYTSGGIKLFLSIASGIFVVAGIEFGMGMFVALWVWGLIDFFRFNPDRPPQQRNKKMLYYSVTAGEVGAWLFAALLIVGAVLPHPSKSETGSIASYIPTVIIVIISSICAICMERTRRNIKKRSIPVGK